MLRFNDNYSNGPRPAININEAHLPVAFICDVSGSMNTTGAGGFSAISGVNACINRFKEDTSRDSQLQKILDVAVYSFSDDFKIIQDFRPVTELEHVNMTAEGGTELNMALVEAVEHLKDRGDYYEEMGTPVLMPYLILITDGYGGKVSKAAELIAKRTKELKMQLWILAVDGYDKETVAKLSNGYDFSEFFNLMEMVLKARSCSKPGDSIHVDFDLKNNDKIQVPDLDEWLN